MEEREKIAPPKFDVDGLLKQAKNAVVNYVNDSLDKSDKVLIGNEHVFIVWFSKTLQNWKAMVSTTLLDGMYYEITYNGDKNEMYLDVYKKWANKRITNN